MIKPLAGIAQALLLAGLIHAGVLALRWTSGPRPVPLLDEQAGAIREVAVHFTPRADFVQATYRDFFFRFPRDVRVYVVCERPEDADEFSRLTGRGGIPVVTGRPITTWARDRFVIGADGTIVTPPEPHAGGIERHNDWYAPFDLARAIDVPARPAPFRFDGGDFCAAGGRLIASSTWTARNPERPVKELLADAGRLFGMPVVYLDQAPDHHVGMVLAPLGNDTILVGDVRWGWKLRPTDLDADLREETARRFDAAAEDLRLAGFRVERIPVLPTQRDFVWITYTNSILEDRVVYLPRYGLPELDAAAAAVYERLGFDVRPVDVSSVYSHGGTLHCLVHVLRRA
jgi:hypothetical protein